MKNLKVKQFESKIAKIVNEQKDSIEKQISKTIESLESASFEVFTNETPYSGEFKNKIFFTYSNHYRANSGVYMQVGELHNPHISYEDRGYIKGVSTDLDGYMKLRSANCVNHNIDVLFNIYRPKFLNSKFKDTYNSECDLIQKKATAELNVTVELAKKTINEYLNSRTGCSLLYYLREI